jgi:hypothetical protein
VPEIVEPSVSPKLLILIGKPRHLLHVTRGKQLLSGTFLFFKTQTALNPRGKHGAITFTMLLCFTELNRIYVDGGGLPAGALTVGAICSLGNCAARACHGDIVSAGRSRSRSGDV